MTPWLLDAVINGVAVRIYHSPARPAGDQHYATINDHSRFMRIEPITVLRVRPPGPKFVGPWAPQYDPLVVGELGRLNERVAA